MSANIVDRLRAVEGDEVRIEAANIIDHLRLIIRQMAEADLDQDTNSVQRMARIALGEPSP